MPTPVEALWELVKSKQFAVIKAHIQAHEDADLINSKHPESGRTLPIYLLRITVNTQAAKPRELLSFLLSHPKMDWNFVSKTKQTAMNSLLESVIVDGDFSVIESLKDIGGFIYNEKLAYEYSVTCLKESERDLALRVEMGKPKPDIDMGQARLDKCKKAVALIRDITILYAIKTDNADLMDRLDKAGGEPMETLGDLGAKKRPITYFDKDKPNLKIKAWLDEKHEKELSKRREELRATTESFDRYAFFLAEEQRIRDEYALRELAIRDRAASARMARIDVTVNIAKEEERRDTSASTGCCVIS